MSHIVTIKTKVRDAAAVEAACRRLGLPQPVLGEAKMYSGQTATGLQVRLQGWRFPVVIDTTTGEVKHDNFGGCWGKQEHLDKFLQAYAVEKVKIEARRTGKTVSEQALADGSVRLTVQEV